MDTTTRNLDDQAYKALRARAVLEARTVGDVISEAIRGYLARPVPGKRSFREAKPVLLPPGNENLSSEVDEIVYGAGR